jgi:hypothetical protein
MATAALSDRVALIDSVRADPPLVHTRVGVDGGYLWSTSRDCYEFMAELCPRGARTLETGLGMSTVLFARWGCQHTCVVPSQEEVDRCVAYLDERGIGRERVTFEVGYSEQVLPRLDPRPLDLVLVDGAHGFPMAIVDFFYTAGRLVEGGVLVLDDLQLPSVRLGLLDFLDRDPRWGLERREFKWGAWRRLSAGALAEFEGQQAFLGPPDRQARLRERIVPRPLRPTARKVRDALSRRG